MSPREEDGHKNGVAPNAPNRRPGLEPYFLFLQWEEPERTERFCAETLDTSRAEPRGELSTQGGPKRERRPLLTQRVALPGCWSPGCHGWNLLPVPFPSRPPRLHWGFSKHTIMLPTNNNNGHAFLNNYISYLSFLPPHFGLTLGLDSLLVALVFNISKISLPMVFY